MQLKQTAPLSLASTTMTRKVLLLILASLIVRSAFAGDAPIPPLKQIEQFGSICIGDGSSYFMFAKDGSFKSGPLGISGRTMTGRWVTNTDGRFVVTAHLGWINGIYPNDHYRRIVFYIPYVTKRAFELKVPFLSSTEVSESYFLIEEMAAISKPANGFDE